MSHWTRKMNYKLLQTSLVYGFDSFIPESSKTEVQQVIFVLMVNYVKPLNKFKCNRPIFTEKKIMFCCPRENCQKQVSLLQVVCSTLMKFIFDIWPFL